MQPLWNEAEVKTAHTITLSDFSHADILSNLTLKSGRHPFGISSYILWFLNRADRYTILSSDFCSCPIIS